MENAIELMNCRAQALALRLGRRSRNGDTKKDAEIILDDDWVISVCLLGGFCVVESLPEIFETEEELEDYLEENKREFETEKELLDYLSKHAGYSNSN
jgi:hypothetical protein